MRRMDEVGADSPSAVGTAAPADEGGLHPIHAAFEEVRNCDELAEAIAFACDQVVTDLVLLSEMVVPLLGTILPLLTCGRSAV